MEDKSLKRMVAIIAAIASFLGPFMISAVNVALPTIGGEFQLNAEWLNWIATSYLLGAAIFLAPIGKIADIYGRKKIFLIGAIMFTISSGLCGIANSAIELVIYRALQGISSSFIFATAMAIIASVFKPEERGKIIGYNIATVYMGLSVGPFIGGFFTDYFGWRSIFFFSIPLSGIIVIALLWKLKNEWVEAKDHKIDFIGSFVYALSLFLLVFGSSKLKAGMGQIYLIIGVILLISFVIIEKKVKYPIIDMELFFENKVFAFTNLASLMSYSATYSISFLFSLYLHYVKGFSPQYAGFILISQPIIQALFSPIAGKLSDKYKPGVLASLGMSLIVVVLTSMAFITAETSIPLIVVGLGLLGLGFAFFSTPNTNIAMSSVSKKFYGVASATLGAMRLLGQMMSMALAMFIFSLIIGSAKISSENIAGFLEANKIILLASAGLCVVGIFASLVRSQKGAS